LKWFRSNKTGSRVALLALAIQFVLSFGHFHAVAVNASPKIELGLTEAARVIAVDSVAVNADTGPAQKSHPSDQDSDQQQADGCAICAVVALSHSLLSANAPVLPLPQTLALSRLQTRAQYVHLNPAQPAFRSRAPPLS
jgi:Protein of unknown function (DUF2946)